MAKKLAKKKKSSKPAPNFEHSIAELAAVVRDLEEGQLSLDASLDRYEEGVGHLKACQQLLSNAERRIELLSGFDAEGNPVTQRFDDEEMTLQEKAQQRSRRRTARPKKATTSETSPEKVDSTDQDDVDSDATLF